MLNQTEIFQIFYHPSQADHLDNSFTPYDNTSNLQPEWCEYAIFRNEFSKEHAKQALPVFYLGNSKKKPALLAVNFLNGFKPTQTTMSISSIHS